MAGFLSGLFSSGIDEVIDSFGEAVDDIVTSDEERMAMANAMATIKATAAGKKLDFQQAEEGQRTTRHDNDMKSDSWLSKNVRPLTLLYLLGFVTLLAITDGNLQWTYGPDDDAKLWAFTIRSEYIQLFQYLLIMVFTFYFTSRGLEKIMAIFKGGK